jgi:type II secretory pathway component PulK
MMARSRQGFALFLVLWMLVGIASLGLMLVAGGRESLQATSNRVALARGEWQAEGCLERVQAAIDDTLLGPASAAADAWQSLDSLIIASPLTAGCNLAMRPAGSSLDVTTATADQLARLIVELGARREVADSVADAILDWQDADNLVRLGGAEALWYDERRLSRPRNGAIAAREELNRIRGLSEIQGIDSVIDVEPGRVLIGRAPRAALAALSGFGPEAVSLAVSLPRDRAPRDLLELSNLLSPAARAELMAHFSELQQQVTFSPDAWIIVATADVGTVSSRVEIRLVRAGTRAAIVRRRSLP